MAASNVTLCGICNSQHVSTVANYWCPECDEGLCSQCEIHHSVSKASRQHGIISINDYKKLPAEICKIEQNCRKHERKFQMFCPRHDQLCCLICISENHKECTGMFPIDEAIKSSRTSTLFGSLEKSLKDIMENIERVVKDREANLVEIKQQHLKILNNIKDTRHKINSRLDELEKHMIDNLNSTETQLKLKIETLLNKLSEKKNEIEILMKNLVSVKQHGSDLQAFIGSKILEKDVAEELKYVKNISKDDGFSQLGLKCQIDDKIIDILSNITGIGSIKIEKSKSPIVIGVGHEKQAHFFTAVPPRSKSIDDITASLIGEFSVLAGQFSSCITGLSVFPDGRMIFADYIYNKRLVIVHSDGTLDCEIHCSPLQPFDVTCIDNKTVAVTMFTNNKIVIVDTKSRRVTKTIETGKCRGITHRQGQILYCELEKGIQAINVSNKKKITIVKDETINKNSSYITTSGENIYNTDYGSTVKCYNVNGDKRWEYKDESILSCATGIAVDQHGIVYVISNEITCVVLISEDGKTSRTLLSAKDGITYSYVIHFHSNKLYVVSTSGVIRIFDIA
ncbi:Hypothetical predicted protein [Mytilus galloprovincialis]|uniref:B box-type domain-containing protein n=1 Tax=Mytilus galloprovincialis TaxID=29158 RepID=A0A8B6GHI3_MYTGA|nr:Hypothetical predicted protein [Mytilus galloprovincialis]